MHLGKVRGKAQVCSRDRKTLSPSSLGLLSGALGGESQWNMHQLPRYVLSGS